MCASSRQTHKCQSNPVGLNLRRSEKSNFKRDYPLIVCSIYENHFYFRVLSLSGTWSSLEVSVATKIKKKNIWGKVPSKTIDRIEWVSSPVKYYGRGH